MKKIVFLNRLPIKFIAKGRINSIPAFCWDIDLGTIWRQAIIWTNADSLHWRTYSPLGRDEFKRRPKYYWMGVTDAKYLPWTYPQTVLHFPKYPHFIVNPVVPECLNFTLPHSMDIIVLKLRIVLRFLPNICRDLNISVWNQAFRWHSQSDIYVISSRTTYSWYFFIHMDISRRALV